MALFLTLAGMALLAAIVSFVLYSHWHEFHGDNHFEAAPRPGERA